MPEDEDNPKISLQGMLLVAHPSLKDPNFRRTVLFISAHDAQAGALGLVLNRPLDKVAAELLSGNDYPPTLGQIAVYLGGPVGHDQLTFAQIGSGDGKDAVRLRTNLSLEEVAERSDEEGTEVRAFVGYAGWASGQLEAELMQKAWVVVRPDLAALQASRHATLWTQIMNSLGPAYKLLAAAPDNPSLN